MARLGTQRDGHNEMNLTKQRLKEIIKEEIQYVLSENSGIKWSKHDPAPTRWHGDVYNIEDEQLIQQALGPDYYVVEFQYDTRGHDQDDSEERRRAHQYYNKYVSRSGARGPRGEIVVIPQKTLEQGGGRVHYFKIAHFDDIGEDGYMYAKLVT